MKAKIPKRTPQEEEELLQKLIAYQKKRDSIPESEKYPISNPEKYNFPIGIGPDGKPFPSRRRKSSEPSNRDGENKSND